jgi:hypothetical protein
MLAKKTFLLKKVPAAFSIGLAVYNSAADLAAGLNIQTAYFNDACRRGILPCIRHVRAAAARTLRSSAVDITF